VTVLFSRASAQCAPCVQLPPAPLTPRLQLTERCCKVLLLPLCVVGTQQALWRLQESEVKESKEGKDGKESKDASPVRLRCGLASIVLKLGDHHASSFQMELGDSDEADLIKLQKKKAKPKKKAKGAAYVFTKV
jgi:hypothetical protein